MLSFRMISAKMIKFVVFELLEFAAFATPPLVIMEQFAAAYQRKRSMPDRTHYWLIVSCSIAYVAVVSLLIWVPIKVLLYKKRHLYKKIIGWRPVLMMCVLFTTLPSFSFSIAVTEVHKNINGSVNSLPDSLPDLPVSLVLLSLILVDIIEKLRIYPLRGVKRNAHFSLMLTDSWIELPPILYLVGLHGCICSTLRKLGTLIAAVVHGPAVVGFYTAKMNPEYQSQNWELLNGMQIKTVTAQVVPGEESPGSLQAAKPAVISRPQHNVPVVVEPLEPSFHSGILGAMSRQDVRAELFLWSFLMWSDTVEMLRVSGHPSVYKSGWLYPVYIFSFISLLRMVFTPKNPLLHSMGILLQDLPFIFVRFSLIIALGTITPVLGLCKNVLVTTSYIYFNYLTRFRPFAAFETSPF